MPFGEGGGQDDDDDDGQGDQTGGQTATPSSTASVNMVGTADADAMIGDSGDDAMSGAAGDDVIIGQDGNDALMGGDGDDLMKGGDGNDTLIGNGDNDTLFGDDGDDMLFGNAGDDMLFGDDGNDVIEGGEGSDSVFAGEGDDIVLAASGDGNDQYWGDAGQDTLDYSAIGSDITADLGSGLLGNGSVDSAQSGHDTVYGFENFIGGSGHDTVIANNAVNVMDGGSGNDTFVFGSASAADGDMIMGFQPGDKIDLAGVDADADAAGNQSFVLFAGGNFTAAGQLAVTYETRADGDHTILSGNTDGDADAEFELDVAGHHNFTLSDFSGVN
jgi:Ca2+-binding RTX toxin-like protein